MRKIQRNVMLMSVMNDAVCILDVIAASPLLPYYQSDFSLSISLSYLVVPKNRLFGPSLVIKRRLLADTSSLDSWSCSN